LADFDFEPVQVALEGYGLVNFKLAEKEWRYLGSLVLHRISGS
jgi:hypothetical protein